MHDRAYAALGELQNKKMPNEPTEPPIPLTPDTQTWPDSDNLALKERKGDHMSAINLKVNGRNHTLDLDPSTPLLYALSDDLELRGPKFGCGLGQCGSCTVIVKGQAVRSCVTTVKSVEGSDITTLEGLGTPEKLHPIQRAFVEEQAAQCGFCLNGVIMTAKAFIDKNPKATEAQIEQAMSGVLCRCFTNVRMLAAIKRYGRELAR